MLVSAEEVLDVRGSLLHVIETEAILLQLLRQLSLYQPKGLPFLCVFFFLSLGQQSRRYYSTLRNIRFPWYSATRPNFLVVFFPICSLTDSRPADTELRLKHILLEASGQIHLHKDVAQVSFVSFGKISHFFNLWWCQALSRKTREREREEKAPQDSGAGSIFMTVSTTTIYYYSHRRLYPPIDLIYLYCYSFLTIVSDMESLNNS